MNERLEEIMNWAEVEDVTYAETANPKKILGAHIIPEGLLVQSFVPTAKSIELVLGGQHYPMELVDEAGFFATLLPMEEAWNEVLPAYSYHITYDNDTTEDTEDPYAFPSTYTDRDIKKYQGGIWYDIYEKMGAHPIRINGVDGVAFSVWAPNAERVSVVGDFNLWDGRRHMMQRLGDSGVFELFIPHLAPGSLYKYEIKCHHQEPFLKIDPYAFGFELRPGNASIVEDIGQFTWTDAAWQQQKAERGVEGIKEEAMSVYELHLGSFARKQQAIDEDGTAQLGSEFYNYRELAVKVADYVKQEGYTHVELMPVMEHPLDASWGYQVTGYYAPTSRYGTPEDFMYFMNYMHEAGIGVILDWVPAHFPRDSWGLAQFDGTGLYENPDPRLASHPHWGTLTFNYRKNEVSNFLIGSAMFWADRYHADGIRMDAVASMLYLDYGRQGEDAPRNIYGGNENLDAVEFLKHLNSQFHKRFPGTLLIAEESTAWPNITGDVEEDGLGFDLKWNMGFMNDFLSYMSTDPFFRKGSYNQLTFSMIYNYSEDFMLVLSHDEVVHGKGSMLGKMPGETFEEKAQNLRAAYGYFWTHPGKKLLFMGQDFGQYDEWSENQELEWNLLEYPVHEGIQNFVRDLNAVYRTHPALWQQDYVTDGFEWINCSYQEESMVMFVRKSDKPEETLLVVSNFDNVAHPKFRVGVPFMCSAKALISSDDKKYGGSGAVKRTAHKAVKADWDERNYAVDLEIPAMSTTIYQLTPCAEPAPKATEAKKAAVKKTAAKSSTAKKTTKKAASEAKNEVVSEKKTTRKKTTVPKQMTEAKAVAAQAVEAAKAEPKKPAAKSTGTKASAQRKSVQKAVLDQKLTKRRKG